MDKNKNTVPPHEIPDGRVPPRLSPTTAVRLSSACRRLNQIIAMRLSAGDTEDQFPMQYPLVSEAPIPGMNMTEYYHQSHTIESHTNFGQNPSSSTAVPPPTPTMPFPVDTGQPLLASTSNGQNPSSCNFYGQRPSLLPSMAPPEIPERRDDDDDAKRVCRRLNWTTAIPLSSGDTKEEFPMQHLPISRAPMNMVQDYHQDYHQSDTIDESHHILNGQNLYLIPTAAAGPSSSAVRPPLPTMPFQANTRQQFSASASNHPNPSSSNFYSQKHSLSPTMSRQYGALHYRANYIGHDPFLQAVPQPNFCSQQHLHLPPNRTLPTNESEVTRPLSSVSVGGGDIPFEIPLGFRFCPTDIEMILDYSMKKVSNQPLPCNVIFVKDIYKCNPWDLPENYKQGIKKWYFFTSRSRKYPNGNRPSRRAGVGYWKATGAAIKIKNTQYKLYTDKVYGLIAKGDEIGTKRALVFYIGDPPRGEKTKWIMYEYNLHNKYLPPKKKDTAEDMRLDDWVLCTLYYKGPSTDEDENSTVSVSNNDIVQDSAISTDQMHHQAPPDQVPTNDGVNEANGVTQTLPNNTAHISDPYPEWTEDQLNYFINDQNFNSHQGLP